jgi:hypothetical protein
VRLWRIQESLGTVAIRTLVVRVLVEFIALGEREIRTFHL